MKRAIVTGSCGFIGTCLSHRLMQDGVEVIGIDSLVRRGSEINAQELIGNELFALHRTDLSHGLKVMDVFSSIGEVDAVFHLAAQVAVTTSYVFRRGDFLDNAVATFNVIEAVKMNTPDAYSLYASTNKVYGHIEVSEPVGAQGTLDPYTPYGVSKATGELYFTEYGREEIGLTTCSLRQSCIYGHHQYGVEDQGWVAWFAIANELGLPVTIYGNGKQIRDLLFVDDLLDLYLECYDRRLTGVYPVGGGASNAIDLRAGLDLISEISGRCFQRIQEAEERPGDQPYFVADLSWAGRVGLDWRPRVSVRDGIEQMIGWIRGNREKISLVHRS